MGVAERAATEAAESAAAAETQVEEKAATEVAQQETEAAELADSQGRRTRLSPQSLVVGPLQKIS